MNVLNATELYAFKWLIFMLWEFYLKICFGEKITGYDPPKKKDKQKINYKMRGEVLELCCPVW